MDRQRIQLGKKWRDITAAAGVSPETLRKIRLHGTSGVEPLNIANVERALEMGVGSIRSIEEGGDPLPASSDRPGRIESIRSATGTGTLDWGALTDRLDGLSLERQQEIIDQVVALVDAVAVKERSDKE